MRFIEGCSARPNAEYERYGKPDGDPRWGFGEPRSRSFDAKPVVRNTNVNGDTRIFLALGEQVLVLGSFPSGLTPTAPPETGDGAYRHGFGVAHFGLRVANVETALAELADSNVPVLSQPIREQSGLTYAYIAAPDGVVVELTQYESPGTREGSGG